MAHRGDPYDDARDPMERDDDIDPINEIEDAVHEQTLFQDENGDFWPVADEDDEDDELADEPEVEELESEDED